MDYYDGSYDYYDAYENWDENQYDESGYGYDGYDEYDQGEEYWYDAEEGVMEIIMNKVAMDRRCLLAPTTNKKGMNKVMTRDITKNMRTTWTTDMGQLQMDMATPRNRDMGRQALSNMPEAIISTTKKANIGKVRFQKASLIMTRQRLMHLCRQFHEQEASSQVHGSDGYDITGTHMSAFPDVSQAAMASEYRTMSYAASDQHLSPMRSERHNHSENYQSFLPGAMFNHDKIPDHGPSRALSLNRSQHLTLQPGYPSPNHASSPTGMFRDLFGRASAGTPTIRRVNPTTTINHPSRRVFGLLQELACSHHGLQTEASDIRIETTGDQTRL